MKYTMNDAIDIVESWRYTFDIPDTLQLFIQHWAYCLTKQFPPKSTLSSNERYLKDCGKLTDVLTYVMLNGEHDPIGQLMSRYLVANVKDNQFFPTQRAVGQLVDLLTTGDDTSGPITLYEPACGSGAMIFESLDRIYFNNIHADAPLGQVQFRVEDINPTAIFAFIIQLIHKFQYLQCKGKKSPHIQRAEIVCCNVLTREQSPIRYLITAQKVISH